MHVRVPSLDSQTHKHKSKRKKKKEKRKRRYPYLLELDNNDCACWYSSNSADVMFSVLTSVKPTQ